MLTTGDKATVVDTDVARVVLVNKPAGLTPLAAIERLRRARPDAVGGREARVGYAGRLDPLARGLLVCVAGPPDGPSLARQKSLETQHKVYEFQARPTRCLEDKILFSFQIRRQQINKTWHFENEPT